MRLSFTGIGLNPTGKTTLPHLNNPFRQGLQTLLGRLPINDIVTLQQKILYFTHFELTFREGKRPLNNSVLIAHSYHQRLTKMGWKLFYLFLICSWLTQYFVDLPSTYPTMLAWLWLGYELFQTASWDRKEAPKTATADPMVHAVAQLFYASILCRVLLIFSNLSGQGGVVTDFISFGFFGAYAGMLRLLRSRSYTEAIICNDCECPLERVDTLALSPTEETETTIESKVYERWRCPDCQYGNRRKQEISTHLISYVLGEQDFQPCPECEALAVEVISRTVEPATTTATGIGITTMQCHHCDYTHQKTSSIPQIPGYANHVRH